MAGKTTRACLELRPPQRGGRVPSDHQGMGRGLGRWRQNFSHSTLSQTQLGDEPKIEMVEEESWKCECSREEHSTDDDNDDNDDVDAVLMMLMIYDDVHHLMVMMMMMMKRRILFKPVLYKLHFRAEASVGRLCELNPYVVVKSSTSELSLDSSLEFLNEFQVNFLLSFKSQFEWSCAR